ncbi:hypothetical protein ACTHGU_16880 [Chitinophagaceae bacterium MMS25-I14]
MQKIFLPVICALSSVASFAQDTPLDTNSGISGIEQKLKTYGKSRYMQGTAINIVTDLPGWEGDTLTLYQYSIADKADTTLTAKVIMYNANDHRIANWIYYALKDCNKKTDSKNIDAVIDYIRKQSGFQFPVRGIVYEDLQTAYSKKKTDGIQETYFFFDGVAVSHKTIKINTYIPGKPPQRATGAQNDALLQMTLTNVERAFLYARISSTLREEYQSFMKHIHQTSVPDQNADNGKVYLETVRKEYRAAMHGKRNNLIAAWVYANIK